MYCVKSWSLAFTINLPFSRKIEISARSLRGISKAITNEQILGYRKTRCIFAYLRREWMGSNNYWTQVLSKMFNTNFFSWSGIWSSNFWNSSNLSLGKEKAPLRTCFCVLPIRESPSSTLQYLDIPLLWYRNAHSSTAKPKINSKARIVFFSSYQIVRQLVPST